MIEGDAIDGTEFAKHEEVSNLRRISMIAAL